MAAEFTPRDADTSSQELGEQRCIYSVKPESGAATAAAADRVNDITGPG